MAKPSAKSSIDTAKLRHEINVRNLTLEQLSVETGRSKSYMSQQLACGEVSVTQAVLMERMYGIMRSDYEVKAPEPVVVEAPVEHETEKLCTVDYDKLYNTIYAAVYAALRMNADELHDRMFNKVS